MVGLYFVFVLLILVIALLASCIKIVPNRIFHAVCEQLGVRNLIKYDRIDSHRYIILCNNRLRRKVYNLLFQNNPLRHLIYERHFKMNTYRPRLLYKTGCCQIF